MLRKLFHGIVLVTLLAAQVRAVDPQLAALADDVRELLRQRPRPDELKAMSAS